MLPQAKLTATTSASYISRKCVIKPVVDVTAFSIRDVFIHAAGFYDDTMSSQFRNKVFDLVTSSYTPALSILAPSPTPSAVPSDALYLLSIRRLNHPQMVHCSFHVSLLSWDAQRR